MMGKLIVLDGLDGSGKTTQFELLTSYFQKQGKSVKAISFPDYKDPSSSLVRMYLAGEFGKTAGEVNAYAASSFYAVDRYASYKRFWEEDYQSGSIILAARYTTSNAIHQMSKLPRDDWSAYLQWLEDYEYDRLGLPRPDAVIFLDMPPEVSQKLMSERYHGDESKKDIHEQDRIYLNHCRQAAYYAAKFWNWLVISCNDRDHPLPVETIQNKIIECIKERLT